MATIRIPFPSPDLRVGGRACWSDGSMPSLDYDLLHKQRVACSCTSPAHPNSSSSKGRAAIQRSLPEPEQKGKIRSRIPGIFLFSFSGVTSRGQGSAPSPKRDTATAASRFARPGNTGVIYLLWIREIPIPRGPREAFRLVAVWDRGSGGRDWAPGLARWPATEGRSAKRKRARFTYPAFWVGSWRRQRN